jgi:hypothetical protein
MYFWIGKSIWDYFRNGIFTYYARFLQKLGFWVTKFKIRPFSDVEFFPYRSVDREIYRT